MLALEQETVNMTFQQFLHELGCDQKLLQKLEAEKIDASTILLMTDDDLKVFFPTIGDRLSVKNFCKKHVGHNKIGLIEKLKNRLKKPTESNLESSSLVKNKRSVKSTRVIELGWMDCDRTDEIFKQVRTVSGGGTRKLNMSKDATGKDVLEKAINLFFPEEKSPKGKESDFDMKLLDFKCNICQLELTIQEMYDISALSMLRLYLGTTCKSEILNKEGRRNGKEKMSETAHGSLRIAETVVRATHSDPEWIPDSPEPRESSSYNVRQYIDEFQVENTSISGSSTSTSDQRLEKGEVTSFYEDFIKNQHFSMDSSIFDLDEENIYILPETTQSNISNNNSDVLKEKETLIVHRGHVFHEILDAMKQRNISFQNIEVEMILPNGSSEKAEDVGGVLRNAISEFFSSFYEVCTMGTEMKIPTLRHDFQYAEWTAIGKINIESCLWQNYFPIKIAPVFVKSCLGQTYNDDEILENFLQYVSRSDSLLLKKALNDFDEVELDDILEFCSTYDGKWAPNKENFKKLITQIAIEEIIQKPNYVQACWQNGFKKKLNHLDMSKMYSKYAPTDKNILSILNIPENLTEEQKRAVTFLKKYIKESDEKCRSAFLRYCTGSNLANGKINVDFNSSTGLGRTPVAHTCNNLLELPTTFESFMIFRSELNHLLDEGVWVMDII